MARQRKLTPKRRKFINGLLAHYKPESAQNVQEMLKDLLKNLIFVPVKLLVYTEFVTVS